MKVKKIGLVDTFSAIMTCVVIGMLLTVLTIPILFYLILEEFLSPPYQNTITGLKKRGK